ncbi:hypothetical protein [Streptomyces halobius]|uniref:Uncharacterized protein n=1 Tax=Streptomyces halobius TaxID=2879846 RepID=A0ABY4M9H3_9ACTN|nr:hypothetical protein [Streptomyces halobius]UQA94023.1 hypothetical protein K9S39_21030 [Streptomyces halobius]
MANQYPGPPQEQPGQNPYTAPPGGKPGDPGYGCPQAPATPPPGPAPQGPPPAPAGGGMQLLSLGDISVTGDTIMTPGGPMPLKGAAWTATDMSRSEERIPAYAIVLAIVFFMACLLGLLFLLMKERTTTGFVQVTVASGGRHHATMIPVQSPDQVMFVLNQVNYARSLSV